MRNIDRGQFDRSPLCYQQKRIPVQEYIALKEAAEILYWLELLHETGYLTDDKYTSISRDAEELRRLLSSVTKTMKNAFEEYNYFLLPTFSFLPLC